MQTNNLEQRISGTSLLVRIGQTVRNYAANAVVAVALAASVGYTSGCGGEESECCEQMICSNSYDENCHCVDADESDTSKCIKNSDGDKECCKCACYQKITDKY